VKRRDVAVSVFTLKRSTGHTHTPTENNTPDTDTRQVQHPKTSNEHLPQTLNNARKRRDDGACHLPRPGGWKRRGVAVSVFMLKRRGVVGLVFIPYRDDVFFNLRWMILMKDLCTWPRLGIDGEELFT